MFGPIWQFFFQAQDQELAQWTVYLPAAADWGIDEANIATLIEVQE